MTVSVKLLVAVRVVGVVLSVTRTEIVNVPAAGGVPLSMPFEVLSASQEGSEVAIQMYGAIPPDAVSVAVYS